MLSSTKLGKDRFLTVADDSPYPCPVGPIETHELSLVCCRTDDRTVRLRRAPSANTYAPQSSVRSRPPSVPNICPLPGVPSYLHQFVLECVRKRSPYATLKLRKADKGCITFDVNGSRWCENIIRHHKSNRIFFVAHLEHGIVYQRCYDPECKGFKSTNIALPENVNPLLGELYINCLGYLNY